MSDDPIITSHFGGVRLVPLGEEPAAPKETKSARLKRLVAETYAASSKLILLISFVALVTITWQETLRRSVILEPIGTPLLMNEMGYSPEQAAHMLWDAIIQVSNEADTSKGYVSFVASAGLPNITEQASGISVRGLADQVRAVFGISQTRVSGEFLCTVEACTMSDLEARIRVFDGETYEGFHLALADKDEEQSHIEALFRDAALQVLEVVDPYVASTYYMRKENYNRAREIAYGIVSRGGPDEVWGHLSLGNILQEQGYYLAAANYFQQAINLDHTFHQAHFNLSLNLLIRYQYEEAYEGFVTVIDMGVHERRALMGWSTTVIGLLNQGKGTCPTYAQAYTEYRPFAEKLEDNDAINRFNEIRELCDFER